MHGIKKMFKKVFTPGTAHLPGLPPKSSIEMIEFSDTVSVASAVTDTSDHIPTNKVGSDSDTTTSSVVIAEGGKSSSPTSVVIAEGGQSSSPTSVVIVEGGKSSSPSSVVIAEGDKSSSPTSVGIAEGCKSSSTTSGVIAEGGNRSSPTSLGISEGGKSSSPTSVVIAEGGKSSFPTSVVIAEGGNLSSPTSLGITESDKSTSPTTGSKKRPNKYMTKKRQLESKKKAQEDKKLAYKQACEQYNQGKFKSIFAASKHFGLSYTCLYRYLVNGDTFAGKGRKSCVLTEEEELKIVNHVIYRQKIGCGMTYLQLQLIIQEVLIAVTTSNPDRSSPYAESGHFPNRDFARALADRHNLTLRATMEISKGRQILGIDDLVSWQEDTEAGLINLDEFKDCFKDGNRIYNQDETSVQVGGNSGKILAERGTKVLYNVGGSSREHVTASFTVSATGSCVPVRLVYKGVRNVAAQHLKDLPTTGKSGAWKFGVTSNGYVTRESYLDILRDLDTHLEENNVTRPVILFMDGPNCHISLQAAEFFKLKNIQPWILRANMTHLLQPLDLTFFCSLKGKLNQLAHIWHADPNNAGQALSKYTVMRVLYDATEDCLSSPSLIPNGFRRSGLFPWNTNAPDKTKLLPSTIYTTTSSDYQCDQDPVSLSANVDESVSANVYHENEIGDFLPLNDSESSFPQTNLFPSVIEATNPLPQDVSSPVSSSSPKYPLTSVPEVPMLGVEAGESLNQSDFEPVLSSTFSEPSSSDTPHWYGQTDLCPNCNRRILKKFLQSHFESCSVNPQEETETSTSVSFTLATPPATTHVESLPPSSEVKLTTLPVFDLDDRKDHLEKFEVVFLKKIQVKEFEDMFLKKQFKSVKDPLYRAWLHLKFAAAGTETEAIDLLLDSKVAKNVPKRKTVRKDYRPKGPARHDPTSPEWVSVLEEQQERQKPAPKRKLPVNPGDVQQSKKKKQAPKKKKSSDKENSNPCD